MVGTTKNTTLNVFIMPNKKATDNLQPFKMTYITPVIEAIIAKILLILCIFRKE